MITVERTDHVSVVFLDRPEKRNALSGPMMEHLSQVIQEASADDAIRVVILTGRGSTFSAGADLSEGGAAFDVADDFVDPGGRVALDIYNCAKPVIGAINGDAVGGAASITLPMDVRLATPSARFGFVFTRRGIVPDGCSTWFLPRVVGVSTALEWLATGRLVDAQTALEHGLIRSLHEPDQLLDAALSLAHEIVQNTAPASVAISRQLVWRMLGSPSPVEALRLESWGLSHRGRSPDAVEGVSSFLEKRPPNFPGKVSEVLPEFLRQLEER